MSRRALTSTVWHKSAATNVCFVTNIHIYDDVGLIKEIHKNQVPYYL